jgi:long-subunit acyl-CoA synthetase (AMP-forming)
MNRRIFQRDGVNRSHYSSIASFHHSNRTTLSLDPEVLEGRLSTGCERSERSSIKGGTPVTIDQIRGMNVAQVIALYGTDLDTRKHTFMMYRDDSGDLEHISYAEFYDTSLRYAELIRQIRAEQGKLDAARFHVGFFRQNIPEAVYLLGGCAFSNATWIGINNAQIGEKLFTDLSSTDIDVVFADEAEQPGSGRTFLESLLEVHQRYGLDHLYPRYIIARKKQAANQPDGISILPEKLAELPENKSVASPLDEDSTGVIIFTSGTTGAPISFIAWKFQIKDPAFPE